MLIDPVSCFVKLCAQLLDLLADVLQLHSFFLVLFQSDFVAKKLAEKFTYMKTELFVSLFADVRDFLEELVCKTGNLLCRSVLGEVQRVDPKLRSLFLDIEAAVVVAVSRSDVRVVVIVVVAAAVCLLLRGGQGIGCRFRLSNYRSCFCCRSREGRCCQKRA